MLSTDLDVLTAQKQRHKHNVEALLAVAKEGDTERALTAEEETQYQAEMKSLQGIKDQMKRVEGKATFHETIAQLEKGGSPDGSRIVLARGREVKSYGQQFVESDAGKYLHETKGSRPQYWTSPSVELKAVLSEGPLVVPEHQPGFHPGPLPAPTVAQLFAPGTTDTNAISFMRETVFTNAAAPVGEGLAKPESAMAFELVVSVLRKIAHWLPATDEILEDAAALRSYIDARLRQGVAVKLDDELLNGDGVAPNLLGLLNTPGLAPAIPQGTNTAADAIAAQIAAIQTSTGLAPSGIVVNPTDWLHLQLAKTIDGDYYGAGPFQAPAAPTLWGVPVAQSGAIALGTALVGAFSTAAQLFAKGGIRVEATNSHQDFFTKNLTAIRAEIRAALAVYRPAAFGLVTGLTATAPAGR